MIYDYSRYTPKPRTVKTKTIREYEYDDSGNVTKETVTVEEIRYEDGGWSQPYITYQSNAPVIFKQNF